MKFIDYYLILESPFSSTAEELKKSYRKQSLKYHPDKNKDNPNATLKQQEINEAYYILGNTEKRMAYDTEYLRYQEFLRNSAKHQSKGATTEEKKENASGKRNAENQNTRNQPQNEDFEVFDEKLRDWMFEAKKQASQVAKQAAVDFKGAVKEGAYAAFGGVIQVIVLLVVVNLIYFIFKGC